MNPTALRRRQGGVTLIEALVALLIMAFGMVAMVGMQSNMRRSADVAKQRSEAVRIAQQDLESLRAYSQLVRDEATPSETISFDQIISDEPPGVGDASANASFKLRRTVTPAADGSAQTVEVSVSWKDRADETQTVRLRSVIARVDPKLSAALTVPPDGSPTRRPLGRNTSIPLDAKDLGDGRSVFKPPQSGSIAWVFDNISGVIISRCSGLSEGSSSASISTADIAALCNNNITAYLLSGHVRFSTGDTPDPIAPSSSALPLDITVTVTPAERHPTPAYQCFDDAPASAINTQTDGVRYFCAVYANSESPPNWSGQAQVAGIALGSSDYRICRYSADYDGSGVISNLEHPASYSKVSTALTGQNYLVVRASAGCPSGRAFDPANGFFFDSRTVQHQP